MKYLLRNTSKASLAALAACSALLLTSCSQDDKKPKETAKGGAKPLSADAVVAASGSLDDVIIATGTLSANEEIELRAETSGRITSLNFREGGSVQKGQLLVKINDAELRAQKNKIELELKTASDDEFRKRELLKINGISKEAYDIALNRMLTLKAEIEYLGTQIDKTEIRAPFTGRIGLRSISEGAYITPQSPVALVQQLDVMKIDFAVPEKYAARMKPGQQVSFTVEGNTKGFTATVFAVEPKVDPSTRTVKVRATAANAAQELVPGSFAKMRIVLSTINDAITLPAESIVPDIAGQKVWVVREGKATPTPVEVGIRTDSSVQILSGIAPGDTVLTTGLLQLRPQMSVSAAVSTPQAQQ